MGETIEKRLDRFFIENKKARVEKKIKKEIETESSKIDP